MAISMRFITTIILGLVLGWFSAKGEEGNLQNNGIHAIGDGNICIYGQNSSIVQLFGPPYSSPSVFHLSLSGKDSVNSVRCVGTAIWNHTIIRNGVDVSNLTDFISSEAQTFIRNVTSASEVEYELNIAPEPRYKDYNALISVQSDKERLPIEGIRQSYLIEVQKGVPLMFSYQPPRGSFYRIMVRGNAQLIPLDSANRKMILKLLPGKSMFCIVAGESLPELDRYTIILGRNSIDSQLLKTRKKWQKFSEDHQKIAAGTGVIGLKSAIDEVAVLIKSQQGAGGGVLAGHNYHMGYVRDQYGVSRALLAMGHYYEAQQILNFFFQNWKESGFIKNAQAIGYPHIFHRHENDEVELTGYLIMQACDYYDKTKDSPFIVKIMPMLEWALAAQKRNLVDGMLPFNGDETYIAGGILPRKVMYNGSAEATLLFIEGANRLLTFLKKKKLWEPERINELDSTVSDCIGHYRTNFFRNGILYTNNPERELKIQYPLSRFGVCLHPKHGGYASEVFHFKGSLYFCKDCMAKENSLIKPPEPEVFNIVSVSLFPIYIHSSLFTADEKKMLVNSVIKRYRETGKVSENNMIPGSDYGLFLDGLIDLDHELTDEVYQKMMNLRDNTGAWTEYYDRGSPRGCKCRPWESGVNIEAAIRYAVRHRE
jgi:hypothetical protein